MIQHMHRQVDKVKKMILSLGSMVEERVRMSSQAIESIDAEIAEKVIRTDYEIDEMEVKIEEECLKLLALYQPVAVDLRFIIAVIKINNELERIGDYAVNIARRIKKISKQDICDFQFDYSVMAEKTQYMLNQSLNALVNLELETAFKVLSMDDEVDAIKKNAYAQIKQAMRQYPENLEYLINLFLISGNLERLADHTTNIAEEVIYLIEGEIIRHNNKQIS
ncbi:MAG: phosphate signaling complex protein PhoU [Desulfobacterales bacterium]|nr:phosphate signaling complex protein PhoU [Desulfobacterales bacterium]